MTFLCKTASEFNLALTCLSTDFMVGHRDADTTKSIVHAYLGQNRIHYPADAAHWTEHFRSLFTGSLTRTAATGN